MKALTIRQPFAHLVVTGKKIYETRTWPTPFRGTLLIHAGRAKHHEPIGCTQAELDKMVTGAIIGSVEVIDCINQIDHRGFPDEQKAMGFFKPGYFAWVLKNPKQFAEPIKCFGSLGFWTPPATVLEKVKQMASIGNNSQQQPKLLSA